MILKNDLMMGLIDKKQPQVANFSGDREYVIKQKYKLLNYCKGGAFGDVFFACHIEKGYDVAVKFVSLKEGNFNEFRVTQKMKRPQDNMIMRSR